MQNKSSKLQNFLGLFAPSPLSGVICVFLAAATLVLNQVDSIKQYLRLPDGLEVQRAAAKGADHVLTSILGESRTDVLVVGAFWALVGLGVYMFLRGLARYLTALDDDISVRRYVWPKGADRGRPLRTMIERTAFRIFALVLLVIVAVGPLSRTLRGPVFVEAIGSSKVLQYVVWFVASLVLWHIVVVLLRLVALRVRLVGQA